MLCLRAKWRRDGGGEGARDHGNFCAHLRDEYGADRLVEHCFEPSLIQGRAFEIFYSLDFGSQGSSLHINVSLGRQTRAKKCQNG
jgi:hypothetical protein